MNLIMLSLTARLRLNQGTHTLGVLKQFWKQKICEKSRFVNTSRDFLHILILFPFGEEENDGNDRCEDFRDGDRVPDAVHIKQKRQKNDGGRLEHERPQEGDRGGNEAVV